MGSIIYSCALIGRVYTNPYIAIAIGLLAGIGASMTLLAIRSWIVQFNSELNLQKIASIRNIGNQIGIFSAILFSLIFLSLPFVKNNTANIILLLISSLPIISALIVIKIFSRLSINVNKPLITTAYKDKNQWEITNIILIFMLISFVTGLYISFISPYTSIILIKYGIEKQYAIAFLLIITLIQILTSIIYLKLFSFNILHTYIIAEILLLISTLIILTSLNHHLTVLLLLGFIARVVILTISAIAEESIHYQYLSSQKNTAYIFGLIQTSFLFGDSLGGLSAPLIITNLSINYVFLSSLFIIGINIILIFRLINSLKTNN